MAQAINTTFISREANADLSSSQYLAVKIGTNGKIALAGANDKDAIGILQNKPEAGETAKVAIGGTAKAIVSEAVVIGVRLTPTAAGKLETVDLADEAYVAKALETGAADGDVIEVLIERGEANTSDA